MEFTRNVNIFGDVNIKNNETYGIIETSFFDKLYLNFLEKIKMKFFKQNILNFSINGSSRNYYYSSVLEKHTFSEMVETIGKTPLCNEVKEEVYRQKFLKTTYSGGVLLTGEPEFLQEQRCILFSYHSRIRSFIEKNKFFKNKNDLGNFHFSNTYLFLPNFYRRPPGKICLTTNPNKFPCLNKVGIIGLKIFENFNYFSFQNSAGDSKKNLKITITISQGLISRKSLFFFVVFFKEKLGVCYNFCEYCLRLFFNFALFIKEPIGILFISLNLQQKKTKNGMNRKQIPGHSDQKILSNLIKNLLVNNFEFQTKTHLWIISCVLRYFGFLFEKIHLKSNILSSNNRFFFKMTKIISKPYRKKMSNKPNLIFQLSKFSGISEARNLIRRFLFLKELKINKILLGFSKKRKFLMFFQKIVEESLYREYDITEIVVNSDPKKNKIELAVKMGKNRICQNIWFQIIRGNKIVANFWTTIQTQWKLMEVSWLSKKNSLNYFPPVVIPDFKINTRNVNFLVFQETQNWKKINWYLNNQNSPLVFPFSIFKNFFQAKKEIFYGSSTKFPNVKVEQGSIFAEITGAKDLVGVFEIPIEFFENLITLIKNPGKTFSLSLLLLTLFRKKKNTTTKKTVQINKLFWRKMFSLKSLKRKLRLLRILLINIIAFNWKKYIYFFN